MTIPANTFEECIPKMIKHEKESHPEKSHDQIVAIAYSKCRKKFGIEKTNILRILEKSALFDEKILSQFLDLIKESMNRKDWIDYSLLLRKEGLSNSEIAQTIPYSESWLKKYVNPKYQEVTHQDPEVLKEDNLVTLGTEKIPTGRKTILQLNISELKKESREFEGWGSVEIKDSQGDIISIDGLEKVMPTYMVRGSPIMFGHTNRHVGKVLKYAIRTKLIKGKETPGLWLKGKIFNDYLIDDRAWESIQLAKEADISVLSLGATPLGTPKLECDDSTCYKKYNDLQLYEFTVTEFQRGSVGANPEAKVERTMIKQKNVTIPLNVAGKFAKLEKENNLPTEKEDLINLMLSSCVYCQTEFQDLIESGKSELEAKEELLKGLLETMNEVKEAEKQTEENVPANDEKKEDPASSQSENDLGKILGEILAGIQAIQQALGPKEAEQEPPEEKPQEEEEKSQEPKDKENKTPSLTLSKEQQAVFEDMAKKLGYQKVIVPTPAVTSQRDLTKGKGTTKTYPSKEERLEALRSGDLSALAERK